MKWFLYLISFLWIGGGTCLILYTQQSREYIKRTIQGMDITLLSIIPITIGALLIVSAYETSVVWLVVLLGVLGIGKGCFFIINPNKLADKLIKWSLETTSEQVYRLAGIICVILGTAMLSWIE